MAETEEKEVVSHQETDKKPEPKKVLEFTVSVFEDGRRVVTPVGDTKDEQLRIAALSEIEEFARLLKEQRIAEATATRLSRMFGDPSSKLGEVIYTNALKAVYTYDTYSKNHQAQEKAEKSEIKLTPKETD